MNLFIHSKLDCISNCKELPVQDYLLNQPSLPAAESPEY